MPKKKMEANCECKICGTLEAVTHYGAISCRACGAFFRRLVKLGLEYECTCQNEQKEQNKKGQFVGWNKFGCKGCRLKKCMDVGMKKELVRAAGLYNFHRNRRQKLMDKEGEAFCNLDEEIVKIQQQESNFLEQNCESKIVKMLIELNEMADNQEKAEFTISMEYFEKFENLKSLLEENKKFFSKSGEIKQSFDVQQFLELIRKNGIYSAPSSILAKALLIWVNFAKALPIFHKLQIADQVELVKNSTMSVLFLYLNFTSAQINSETMVNSEGMNLFQLYAQQYSDPIVLNASTKIFLLPIREFIFANLDETEFVLLTALLYSNPSIPGLSPQGQQILKGEEEKYGKMLLGLQQRRFGENAGALRYMETLRLLWSTIRQMHRNCELAHYIDTFHEFGRYKNLVPKALFPLINL